MIAILVWPMVLPYVGYSQQGLTIKRRNENDLRLYYIGSSHNCELIIAAGFKLGTS